MKTPIEYMRPILALAGAIFCSGVLRADAATPAAQPEVRLPEYSVQRTRGPIAIDGVLNEASWQRAASTGAFGIYPTLDSPRRTEAKLLWDDERLYIAIICTDTDIRATRKVHDDDIYAEDCVEFFIMEQHYKTRHNHFLEYQINALGTRTDAYNIGVFEGVAGWDSKGWRSAVKVDGTVNNSRDTDRGWTVEMSIPFFDFYAVLHRTEAIAKQYLKEGFPGSTPRPGDRWRANLYRLKYLEKKSEYAAWSPNRPPLGFHDLERFGTLVFSDLPAGAHEPTGRANSG